MFGCFGLGHCYLLAPLGIFCLRYCLFDPLPELTQLLFQIMILFGKAFHYGREGLDLPFQGSGLQFVSLNVVGGRHRASKYHVTLCLGSDSMANLVFPINGAN